MTVFAALGEFEMDVLTWLGSHQSRYAAVYAEHGLIGRKPALQATGLALDEHQIGTMLHHMATDPGEEIRALREMQNTFAVLPFVFASGEYLGTFVITDMDVTAIHYSPQGVRLASEVTLSLKEYTGDPAKPNPPGVIQPMAPAPIDATTFPEIPTVETPENLLDTVNQTIEAIGVVGEAAARANDIVATAMTGDILGAVGLAGQLAPELAEYAAMLPVEELQDLEDVVTIAGDAGETAHALRTAQTLMNQAGGVMEGASGLSGFSSAAGLMQGAVAASSSAAPSIARMQAFAETGSRLGGARL